MRKRVFTDPPKLVMTGVILFPDPLYSKYIRFRIYAACRRARAGPNVKFATPPPGSINMQLPPPLVYEPLQTEGQG